jgi:hypothetical protein
MNGALNPVREIWTAVTIPPGGGTTGDAVDLSVFAGPVTVQVIAGAGVTAPIDVTFESAKESASAFCTPDASTWTPISKGGFCSPVEPLKITVDPAADPYLTDSRLVCRDVIQCPAHFVRARLSAAGPIAVIVMGKARRLEQV